MCCFQIYENILYRVAGFLGRKSPDICFIEKIFYGVDICLTLYFCKWQIKKVIAEWDNSSHNDFSENQFRRRKYKDYYG